MLKWWSSILFLLLVINIHGQHVKSDMDLIQKIDFEKEEFEKRTVYFNQVGGDSYIKKYNPFSLTANSLLFLYQQLFSVQISASCLYHTSCSEFSKNLIHDYGIIKGTPLSADRLTRCNKIAATDIHPLKINEESLKVDETTEIYKNKK